MIDWMLVVKSKRHETIGRTNFPRSSPIVIKEQRGSSCVEQTASLEAMELNGSLVHGTTEATLAI